MVLPECSPENRCRFRAVPLEEVTLAWDGKALGRKAVSVPDEKTIYLDSRWWAREPTVDGRAITLFHELAHIEGAMCERCADRHGAELMKRHGFYTQPRDAARAMFGNLENRDHVQATADVLDGFGYTGPLFDGGMGLDDVSGPDVAALPQRSDTGYSDGKPFPIVLVNIAGAWVDVEVGQSLSDAVTELAALGVPLVVDRSFATFAEQEAEYAKFKASAGAPAYKPGFSMHQQGKAVDYRQSGLTPDQRDAFYSVLSSHGWVQTHAGEPWHIEYRPGFTLPGLVAGAGGMLGLVALGLVAWGLLS